jgi:hypothetical protein
MRATLTTLMTAALLLIGTVAANASLEVTRSTAPRVKVGTKFNDNAVFDVPAGRKIEVLKTPQNTTHELAGPYSGTLAGYKTPCPWWKAVVGSCKEPGDTREGATRGLRAPPPQ